MDNIMLSIRKWLEDPFGRKNIKQTHDPLLTELQSVKHEAEIKIQRAKHHHRAFPIAHSVGNRRLRGEAYHVNR